MSKYLLLLRNANNYEDLYKIKYFPIKELEQYPYNIFKVLIATRGQREICDSLREMYQIQILPVTYAVALISRLELYWYAMQITSYYVYC